MNALRNILVILLAVLCQITSAQITGEVNVLDRDVFYVNYIPLSSTNDFEYQRLSSKLGMPPIYIKKLSLYNTVGIDMHSFNYQNNLSLIHTSNLERFYNINYSLFSNYKLSNKWSLNALGNFFINSNLEDELSGDDFNFNGNIYVERTFLRKNGGYFLVGLGAAYMILNGSTNLTPMVHVKARLNEHWSFVVGLPNTYVKWDINKNHSLKVLGELNDFSANINTMPELNNANKTVFTTASVGLEYNYWISSFLGVILRGNYPVWDNYELRNSDNDAIYKFDSGFNQPIISIGVKFNPLRNLQNGLNPF